MAPWQMNSAAGRLKAAGNPRPSIKHLGAPRRYCASTGDIFRPTSRGETPLGVEAKKYMDAGGIVPDSLTNKMVRDRLSEGDVETVFLLDG